MAIYIGLRNISKRMGYKSPSTVLKHASLYQDQELNFPLVLRPLPNGRFVWITDDLLIKDYLKAHRRANLHLEKRVSKGKPKILRRTCERCGETILGHRGYATMKRILTGG